LAEASKVGTIQSKQFNSRLKREVLREHKQSILFPI